MWLGGRMHEQGPGFNHQHHTRGIANKDSR
jgi:hypothetical protein